MEITRVNGYQDPRFPCAVLQQHGAFLLADEIPCTVEIISPDTAILRCPAYAVDALIDEFRFYAEHITRFVDDHGVLLRESPQVVRFPVEISAIQPSQFFVDEDKLAAVRSFVHKPEDVVIPLLQHQGRFVSLDGHTRLYAAMSLGFTHVYGYLTQADDSIIDFVAEAQARGILSPAGLTLLPHAAYCKQWDAYCDDYFSRTSQG